MRHKKIGKKISAVLVIIMLAVLSFNMAAPPAPLVPGPDEVLINGQIVKKSSIKPSLNVMGNMPIPNYVGGQDVLINIPVENNSEYQAANIYVELQLTGGKDSPFEIQQLKLKEKIPFVYPRSQGYANFRFRVKDNAEDGLYPIPVKITYGNSYGYNDFESTDTIYIQVKGKESILPDLMINDIKVNTGEVEAGNSAGLTLSLLNQGQYKATDVKVSLEGFKNEEIMPDPTKGVEATTSSLGEILPGSSKDATFSILANEKMKSGNYKLTVKINYKDANGKAKEESKEITVPVGETLKNPSLTISNLTYPTNNLKREKTVDISFRINNHSEYKLYDLKVTLEKEDALVMKSQPVVKFDDFYGYYSKDMVFSVEPTKEAIGKSYPIAIKLEYKLEKGSDKVYTYEKYLSLLVEQDRTKTDIKQPKTKLIISNYTYGDQYVEAGKPFTLNVTLQNTNASRAVRNIKVSVSSQDGIFAPVGSSNTFYFDSMKAKGTASLDLTMKSKIDAEQKSYNVYVDMEYEDYEGNEYVSKETIGVAVVQDTRLNIGELNLPPQGTVGMPLDLSLPFYNFGKTILRNLIVKVEGDFMSDPREMYYGNFNSGSEEFFNTMLTPMNPGENKGKLVFSFEDAMGNTQNIEKEIILQAMEMEMPEMPEGEFPMDGMDGDMGMESQNGIPLVAKIAIGAGVVVVVGVVTTIILKKRKKKRQEFLSEEEEIE